MNKAPVTFQNRLSTLFNLHSGEERQVTLLLIHAVFIGFARIFSRIAAFTLFLIEFDAIQTLPYVYVGISVIVALAAFIYLKLGERLPLTKLLITNLGFLLLLLLGFWSGLQFTTAKWLIFALPIGYEILYTFTNLAFWNLNGRLFNVRQGKRLFGLLSSGKTAAVIAGGFLVAPLVSVIGTINLFLVAAAAMLIALGLLVYISRVFQNRLSAPSKKTPAGDIRSTTQLLRNQYILLTVGFFALGVIVFFVIENIFYTQTQVQFTDEDQLATFIGAFFGFAGFLTLVGQSFFTGRIIRQYGLRWVGLLLSPVALLISTGLMAVGGTLFGSLALLFSLTTVTKLINVVFRETIDRPVTNILYQPLSSLQRTQAQTVVEGLIYPLAVGAAGVVLTFSTTIIGFGVLQLTYVLIIILLAWIGTAILEGNKYLTTLMDALARKRITATSIVTDDRSSKLVLQQALQSQSPAVVIYALNVLQESEQEQIADHMPGLLFHPVPEVRIDTLERIEKLRLYTTLEHVWKVIKVDSSTKVKSQALIVLAALGDAEIVEQLFPYLNDPDPQLRLGAIIGALRNGDVAISMMAQGRLLQLAVSPDSNDRILACAALGIVRSDSLKQLLNQLIHDEDFKVRRAALESAGQAQYPELWPDVIAGITEPETRRAAVAALVAGGEAVIPSLKGALEKSELQQGVLTRLVRVCGRIGGDQATTFLFDHLAHPDKEIRTGVLVALSQCGFRANDNEQVLVHRQIEVELSQATSILASLADINRVADDDNSDCTREAIFILSESLAAELKEIRSRILLLLSFMYDAGPILRAWDTLNLSYASTEEQAHAVEVIDVLIPSKLKSRMLPLLDKMSFDEKLRKLSRYNPQESLGCAGRLGEILGTTAQPYDRWIKANALYTIARLNISDAGVVEQITAITGDAKADPFLMETAHWTLTQLGYSAAAKKNGYSRPDLNLLPAGNQFLTDTNSRQSSLSTIEKVIILKNIGVFSQIPNEILIDLAALLEESRAAEEQLIISEGDTGDCLYIIVGGKVCVHVGTFNINHLGAGDVFGEMALLDPSPRSASVTAIEETRLLRLGQRPFYQLMEDRIEMARGVIRVLSGRLRNSVNDLRVIRGQLEASNQHSAEISNTTSQG
jgi:AAA family ATP:ADP antiporter